MQVWKYNQSKRTWRVLQSCEYLNLIQDSSSFIYNQMATWNSTGAEDITFGEGFGGISSLNVGPDGYLYVVSFTNGKIYKIMPS
jgi:hypothetical protein